MDRAVLIAVAAYMPKGHFSRHLHRALGLSFVRALAAARYATGGWPSIGLEVCSIPISSSSLR